MPPKKRFPPCLTAILIVLALPAASKSQANGDRPSIRISPPNAEELRWWPRWRGPSGQGIAQAERHARSWTPEGPFLWKVPISGRGASSPIVWDDVLFLTSSDDNGQLRTLLALDRTDGSMLWKADAPSAEPERIYPKNTWASSTPVTDGDLVFAYFGNHGLLAVDFDGKARWHQSFGDVGSRHGTAGSPVLWKDRVILYQDHNGPAGSFVAAFEKTTGRQIWRTPRSQTVGWGSAIVIDIEDHSELIVSGQNSVEAYDPVNGSPLWSCSGNLSEVTPTPVVGAGLVFCSSGRAGPTLAIRPGGRGDVSESHLEWKSSKGSPFVPSPIYADGRLYLINDMISVATAIDARTGDILWQGRLGESRREGFSASPVLVDDEIYFTNDEGETFVVATGDTFELLRINRLGEQVLASPALVEDIWYWRTSDHLIAIAPQVP